MRWIEIKKSKNLPIIEKSYTRKSSKDPQDKILDNFFLFIVALFIFVTILDFCVNKNEIPIYDEIERQLDETHNNR